MTQEHAITPPPELVTQWFLSAKAMPVDQWVTDVATQASRWGADQELEACINHFHEYDTSWGEDSDLIAGLRAARRPKPLSLKEQALEELELLRGDANAHGLGFDAPAIRRALESLPD